MVGPRHLLSLLDLTGDEVRSLLAAAGDLKARRADRLRVGRRPLEGRAVALVFEKASTRTRVSFELAVAELGGKPVVIEAASSQLGRGEPVRDTARVLGRYVDAIVYRTSGQERLEEMARFAGVPVINGLSDLGHPCQVLADLLTVVEDGRPLEATRFAWIGDGNNMANSWIEAASLLGFELVLACPAGYEPDAGIRARTRGARVRVTPSPEEAARGAHVVMTDVWASMGQEAEAAARRAAFAGFRVDGALLGAAAPGALVLHCLPAHRGEEISDEVLEGAQSAVWRQAENRLHAQKAILTSLLA